MEDVFSYIDCGVFSMKDKETLELLKYELLCCEDFRKYQEIKNKIESILGNYSKAKKGSRKKRFAF